MYCISSFRTSMFIGTIDQGSELLILFCWDTDLNLMNYPCVSRVHGQQRFSGDWCPELTCPKFSRLIIFFIIDLPFPYMLFMCAHTFYCNCPVVQFNKLYNFIKILFPFSFYQVHRPIDWLAFHWEPEPKLTINKSNIPGLTGDLDNWIVKL